MALFLQVKAIEPSDALYDLSINSSISNSTPPSHVCTCVRVPQTIGRLALRALNSDTALYRVVSLVERHGLPLPGTGGCYGQSGAAQWSGPGGGRSGRSKGGQFML